MTSAQALRKRAELLRLLEESGTKQQIMNITGILDLALDGFDSPKIASEFLLHPHSALKGASPWTRLGNEEGCERVERLLASIVYGLPA